MHHGFVDRKCLQKDRRSEPRVGERVPYVIVYGTPGLPLIQLVRQPHDVINDAGLRINSQYYIKQQILPPLSRVLSLVGVDVFSWYDELPRVITAVPQAAAITDKKVHTLPVLNSSKHQIKCLLLTILFIGCVTCL